jgi:transposase
MRQLDFHGEELSQVDHDIALEAIDDPIVARLMPVPGIDVTVAISILAAVGDFARFDSPIGSVSYLGLNPRIRQSGTGPQPTGGSPRPARLGSRNARRGRFSAPSPGVRCALSIGASRSAAASRSLPSRPRAR